MKKLLISAIMIGFVIAMVTFGTTEDKKSQDKNEVQIKIEKLIRQLGAYDFEERETAQKELTEYGTKTIEQYRAAKRGEKQAMQRPDESGGYPPPVGGGINSVPMNIGEICTKTKEEIEKFSKSIQNACQSKDPEIKNRANQIRQHFYSLTQQPKIAFISWRDGNSQIYIMDSDGKNQTRLTENKSDELSPAWSPDGKKIAFASDRDRDGASHEIYVMDADGKNQTRLTENKSGDLSPAWSPDGKKIAFTSYRDGNHEIYVMDADGKNQINLTENKSDDLSPVWNPDGKKIAFHSNRDGNLGKIYVMDADGKNQTKLTENKSADNSSVLSPDGKKIAFTSYGDGNGEIYVMDADSKNKTRLTENKSADYSPVWGSSSLPELSTLFAPLDLPDRQAGEKDKK